MSEVHTSNPPVWDIIYAVLQVEIRSSTLDKSDLRKSCIDHLKYKD